MKHLQSELCKYFARLASHRRSSNSFTETSLSHISIAIRRRLAHGQVFSRHAISLALFGAYNKSRTNCSLHTYSSSCHSPVLLMSHPFVDWLRVATNRGITWVLLGHEQLHCWFSGSGHLSNWTRDRSVWKWVEFVDGQISSKMFAEKECLNRKNTYDWSIQADRLERMDDKVARHKHPHCCWKQWFLAALNPAYRWHM